MIIRVTCQDNCNKQSYNKSKLIKIMDSHKSNSNMFGSKYHIRDIVICYSMAHNFCLHSFSLSTVSKLTSFKVRCSKATLDG